MWNKKTVAVAAANSVDPQAWRAEFETAFEQVAARFARRDARGAARDLLAGLVAPLERKNCWTIAEHAGHESPHGSSTCWAGRSGMPTPSATTCATT